MRVPLWLRLAAAALLVLFPDGELRAQAGDPYVSYHILHADHHTGRARICIVGPMIRLRYDRSDPDWLDRTMEQVEREENEFALEVERRFGWDIIVFNDQIGLDDQAQYDRITQAQNQLEHRYEACRVGPYHRRIIMNSAYQVVSDGPGALAGGGSSGSSRQDDDDDDDDDSDGLTQGEMMLLAAQSEQLEAEGDRYNQMGTLGYQRALQLYREAYQIYPTSRVAQKISNLEGLFAAVELGQAATEKLDEGFAAAGDALEEAGIASFIGPGFTYEYGLGNAADEPPAMALSVGATMHWLLSIELRIGYFRSPVFEAQLRDENDQATARSIRFSEQGGGVAAAIGVSYPIGRFMPYAMWGIGYYGMAGTREATASSSHAFTGEPIVGVNTSELMAGVNYRFSPAFGIGLRYSRATHRSESDGEEVDVEGSSLRHYVIEPDAVTYGSVSVQVFINMY